MKTNLVKYRAILFFSIKSLIICLSFWFIYDRILVLQDFGNFQSYIKEIFYSPYFIFWFIVVFMLFLLNWGTEALKWKMITRKMQEISFCDSFKAVCSGVTVGLITPNRMGEFGGRILYINKKIRIDAIVGAIAGSLSQLFITIICGLAGAMVYSYNYRPITAFNNYWLLLIIVICFYLYFNIHKIPLLLKGKAEYYLKAFALFNNKELLKIIWLSLLRYFIFFLQFYILLWIFKIELYIAEALVLLPLIFLVIAVIPTFALVEWGVRGSAAVFFISTVSANSTGILAAATALWVINILIPALLGAVFIAKHKLSE